MYCVDNGFSGHASEFEESGHLIFIDPRQASMFLDEYGRRLHRDISFDGVKYFLADGDIVIFLRISITMSALITAILIESP